MCKSSAWQNHLIQHGLNSQIINDDQAKIVDASWKPETGEWFDDVITKINLDVYKVDTYNKNGVLVNTMTEESIYDYLGY